MEQYRVRVEVLKSDGVYFIPLVLKSQYDISGIRRNDIEKVIVHDQKGDLLGYGEVKEHENFYGLNFKVNSTTRPGKEFSSNVSFHSDSWFDLHFTKGNVLSKVQYQPFSTKENLDFTAV